MDKPLDNKQVETPQSQNIFTSAEDFDQKLLPTIAKYLQPYGPMIGALINVRASAILRDAASLGLPAWPYESTYVCMDGILSIFQLLKTRGLLQDAPKNPNEDDEIMEMIYAPSILSSLLPWEKSRNIVHLNKKEFAPELLDCSSGLLAKMPAWAVCFNLVGQGFDWNGHEVAGVIFSRYFLSKHPEAEADLGTPIEAQAIGDEVPGVINNMNSVIIFADGTFDLGPYCSMSNDQTIAQFFNSLSDSLEANSDLIDGADEKQIEELKEMANHTAERGRRFFSYLVYLIQHLDELKDAEGNKVSFLPNPGPVVVDNQVTIPSINIQPLYLD